MKLIGSHLPFNFKSSAFNVFQLLFSHFQIRDSKPQWIQIPKKSHFKYLISLLGEDCGAKLASLAFEGFYFKKIYETFFWFFAHCVMLHETAGILTIITASVITPAGVSNDFNADYIY